MCTLITCINIRNDLLQVMVSLLKPYHLFLRKSQQQQQQQRPTSTTSQTSQQQAELSSTSDGNNTDNNNSTAGPTAAATATATAASSIEFDAELFFLNFVKDDCKAFLETLAEN
jgi:hypothetical protein